MSLTQSLHVESLVKSVRRYRAEICLSASGNVSFVKKKDYGRWESYFKELRGSVNSYATREMLDLVETHGGNHIDLGEMPPHPERENSGVNMLCRYLMTLEHELVHSQSSRLSNGLISHDQERCIEILDALDLEMESMKENLPLDLPETAPSQLGVGAGSKGINPKSA